MTITFGVGGTALLAGETTSELKIALIGDSTVISYDKSRFPLTGWSQMLAEVFRSDALVLNEAKSGTSSLSFPAENWKRVLDAKPDFIFIQFGHNDMKGEDLIRYTDPGTAYRDNLKRFIRESMEIGDANTGDTGQP